MSYVEQVMELVKKRNPAEPEFLQAVKEVLVSVVPVIEKYPEYQEIRILERITEPERVIISV
jgi:glutamate dehydrogenase (NADP+)